jgi:hypothetical protein
VRWSHWLAAFTTAINSEIMDADASEFYQTGDGQWVWDTGDRKLKTVFRPRITPLHSAIIREGFVAYLETRRDKKLFDENPNIAGIKANELVHSLGIEKTFYSWRHRVVHRIDKLTAPSLSRFIAGHAAKDIHEKFYLHHELPEEFGEIVAAIEGLTDPTG